jgi:G3E family GTPase
MVDCLQMLDGEEDETARRQIELADAILLSKSDLASRDQYANAQQRAAAWNPLAPRVDAAQTDLHGVLTKYAPLNVSRLRTGFFQSLASTGSGPDTRNWRARAGRQHLSRDPSGVATFSIELGASICWSRFAVWLSLLLHTHGDNVLRIKGLLALEDASTPVLVNCVRHVVYFPEHLGSWPDEGRVSRLVFIVRNMDPERIRRSLNVFALTDPSQ